MKKNFIKTALFLMMLCAIFTGCKNEDSSGRECFSIRLPSDTILPDDLANTDISQVKLAAEPIMSEDDIILYEEDNHVIRLTETGKQKLAEQDIGNAFFVCVGDQPIYAGVIWSHIFSRTFDGVTLIAESSDNTARIEIGYPTSDYFTGNDPRSDSRIMTALKECGKLGTSSSDTDSTVIMANGTLPDDWDNDPYIIENSEIKGDEVRFSVHYSGGCETHEFKLVAWNYFLESYPVQAEILLAHDSNGDPCEAEIRKELTFDLSRLKDEYQKQYPNDTLKKIIMRIRDANNAEGYFTLEYTFSSTEKAEVLRSDLSRETSPDVSEEELNELVTGNNAFAFDLYQAIREQDGNLFYSPYSISLALAMTYAGARDETARQMKETCHFTLPQERLHPGFNALDIALASRGENSEGQDGKGFRLNIANSIWGQKDYFFLTDFLDVLARNYGAGMNLLDFAKFPEESRIAINNWVSEKTEEKIEDLIPSGAILSETRLVLTNAIYFNAAWSDPFEEEFTRDNPFYLSDGTSVTVPMMSQTENFRYAEGEDFQAVELMYDGRKMSMVILLPGTGKFEAFEESLTHDRMNEISDRLAYTKIRLALPEFSYESESVSLKKTLSRMGMPIAFSYPEADFSGIDGTRYLFIGDVLHKGFVSVDEAGTEAAAATAVIVLDGATPEEPLEVTIDRPFIFFIRDIQTNSVLFIGRILNSLR
ncbi:serpin family protein [Desulfococcaceae bacterium HSG8]|nr:serpin family protein [Desulfococcaceae bacterium HSG8]